MKKIENSIPSFMTILNLACLIYMPISVLINFICGISITTTTMLQLWSSALIFGIALIISIVVAFLKNLKYKKSGLNYFVSLYAALSFSLCTFATIVKGTTIWSLLGMLLIIVYSLIISVMITYVKIKNFLISALFYYAVSVISFMILTTLIGGYNSGNISMILYGSFTLVFLIGAIVYFFIRRSFAQYDNEEKDYKRQFD